MFDRTTNSARPHGRDEGTDHGDTRQARAAFVLNTKVLCRPPHGASAFVFVMFQRLPVREGSVFHACLHGTRDERHECRPSRPIRCRAILCGMSLAAERVAKINASRLTRTYVTCTRVSLDRHRSGCDTLPWEPWMAPARSGTHGRVPRRCEPLRRDLSSCVYSLAWLARPTLRRAASSADLSLLTHQRRGPPPLPL